jgi:uncharacterized membrane protein YfcA
LSVALVALSALAAATIQASTGMGFALVLGPAAFALLDPTNAIVALTALGLALNLLVLFGERRRPVVAWGEVRPMLLAAAPGAVCGVVLLRALPKPALQIAVGVAVMAAALVRVPGQRRAVAPAPTPGHPRARLALGFATGTLTTSAGVNGPPMALWFTRRGLTPAQVRDSLSAAFLGLSLIGAAVLAPVLAAAGEDVRWPLLAAGLVSVVAGHAVGRRVFAVLEGRRYEPLLLAVAVAAGTASIVAGVIAAT